MSSDRRKTPDDPLTETERQALRAVIGSLLYAGVNTRPDLCSRLGNLQSKINNGQVKDLQEANRTLHEAKTNADVTIKYQSIEKKDLRFVTFSDASFASEKNHSSHQGLLIMASHKNIANNQEGPVNPIIWASRKIQKVAVSTLSAEAMSLASAVDSLSWVRLFIDNTCEWKLGDKTLLKLPPAFSTLCEKDLTDPNESLCQSKQALDRIETSEATTITDCKSLYDLVNKNATPSCSEYRTLLQAKLIKEQLSTGIHLRWVPTGAQLADCLTKIMDNSVIRAVLKYGVYKLFDEGEILRKRANTRTRMQWLRQNLEKPSRPEAVEATS